MLTRQQSKGDTKPLRTYILRALAAPISFAAVSAILVMTGPTATGEPVQEQSPAQPSQAERLIERHGCWVGDAPADVIPGHAIVSLPGEGARRVASDVGFGIWLDGDPGKLWAFCP